MARFDIGERVRVRDDHPPGHIRTPFYVRGKQGVIADSVGAFPNPELAAKGQDGTPHQPLYRVRFAQKDAWPGYQGPAADTLDVEIYEHWLEGETSAHE
jgi:hypothetical protein